jgi:5-methyltetrahydropteroyltriglutamate--homocysteine methyltransferase
MASKYRADQVGSLLRPKELLDLRHDLNAPPEILREKEDQEILRVLGRQKDLGFKIFTDGELRRHGFMSDFHESVEGLDMQAAIDRNWQSTSGKPGAGVPTTPTSRPVAGIAVSKLRKKKRLTEHETTFLKQHSPGDIKMTLPSANQFPAIAYRKGITDKIYPTHSELLWDIVPIIKSEIQALVKDGVKYIQIDAPRYSYFIDPKWRQYIKDEMGVDPSQALDEAIKADNASLEGARREGVTLAIHLCRGNNRSQWYAQGSYDPIAEKVFSQLDVDAFLLEYESERAGSFEPLRFVPKGKNVVLGLVSSKLPQLESQDELVGKIEEAGKFMPLQNLALSPQCGFASTMEGNLLTEDQQWRKLDLVAKTARQVWQDA